MTAAAHVALVVDNSGSPDKGSKRTKASQSYLTDKHPIYGGQAEVVRTQQSGGYWHFRMWISDEQKYVRKTLKTRQSVTGTSPRPRSHRSSHAAYLMTYLEAFLHDFPQ